MLKKAVEAKKQVEAKMTALLDANKALEAKAGDGVQEEEYVKELRFDLENSRTQVCIPLFLHLSLALYAYFSLSLSRAVSLSHVLRQL